MAESFDTPRRRPRASGFGPARRALGGLLILLVAFPSGGCARKLVRKTYTPADVAHVNEMSWSLKAHTRDGRVYVLSPWDIDDTTRVVTGTGELRDANRTVIAAGVFSVPIDSVAIFETNDTHPSLSVALLAIVTAASVVLTAYCIQNPKACFGSCPTFYVERGGGTALVAEGFSSSIAPSLEASDVDALLGVAPRGEDLAIEMKNEALETHVVRHVALLAAPRARGGRVFATTSGEYWDTGEALAPTRCIAPEGDCAALLRRADGDERFTRADPSDLGAREEIEIEFDGQLDGEWALALTARQTLLSTYVFYQTLAYMGASAGEWFARLERGDSLAVRAVDGLSRALGGIEIFAPSADGEWRCVARIDESGPLASDAHAAILPQPAPDRLRLRMARGLYRIDSVALVRLRDEVEPVRIAPIEAARDGAPDGNALESLRDGGDALVTYPGDAITLRFPLPAHPENYDYFLESRGYYIEWMRQEWLAEEDPARLARILFDPEGSLRAMAPEFAAQEPTMEAAFWGSRYAKD
ncbi:MAG: hypothetical protein ACKVU1_10835 [bacterium]